MNEDGHNLGFKPKTLYSFFPKEKRLRLAKKDSSVSSKIKKQNNNLYSSKNNRNLKNNKYDYHYNFSPNNFNYLASSTSNNFYHKNLNQNSSNNNYITRKHSMNYKRDNKRLSGNSNNFYYMNNNYNMNNNNFETKEINEKYLEQFLEHHDNKLRRNKQNIKQHYTNSGNINNMNNNNNNLFIKSSKNNITRSTSKNSNYMNSNKYKGIIRLKSDKLYNYLPYLDFSSKKNKKSLPKTLKQILLNENYNINTINGDIRNYYNNVQTLYKNIGGNNNDMNNIYKINNTVQKNNFFQLSMNPMLSSFNTNNNVTTNSDVSNLGNNNIIFNNYGSINNNIFIENPKKNFFEENQRGSNKELSNDKYQEKEKERVMNNYTYIKDKENTIKKEKENKIEKEEADNTNDKEIKDIIKNKQRAFSTVPYKPRKNSKKATINIECKEKQEKNEVNNNTNEENNNNNNNNKKDKLAKYEIGPELGKGAYAKVKLATNKITKEKFAIKIYEKEKLNSNSKKSCVYKEIQILKKLKHKNIVRLIEVISTETQILIVQELIEGISLREYYNNEIRNQKGISIHKETIFRKIFYQIFSAMDYLHKHNMAHRDIKLENILIKNNYEIKIIDFGFGMYNPEKKLQKFFCGTPNYMPPEIAEKKPYIGQLADMWSLGILVYKIFCADFPFKGKDEKELYKAIKIGKFSYAKYTPEYARKIIGGLIVLDPNKRMNCEDVLNSEWLKERGT